MVSRRKDTEPSGMEDQSPRRPPATTPELREQELIALAFDVVESRLRKGTATSQETVHFLKLGTENTRLEREKLRKENLLLDARTEQMGRADHMEQLLDRAVKAFKGYSGEENPEDDEYQE